MSTLNLPQVLVISRGLIEFNGKYLFIKRQINDSYAPNTWEFPGGKLDQSETIEENLVRECVEEIGISLTPIKTDLAVINEIGSSGKYKGILAITILGLLISKTDNVKLSDEHSDSKWLSLEESLEYKLTPATKILVEKIISDDYLMALLNNSKDLSLPSK